MRSALAFQLVTMPSSVLLMIASSADSTMAARYAADSLARRGRLPGGESEVAEAPLVLVPVVLVRMVTPPIVGLIATTRAPSWVLSRYTVSMGARFHYAMTVCAAAQDGVTAVACFQM